jgi:hypothetical protein
MRTVRYITVAIAMIVGAGFLILLTKTDYILFFPGRTPDFMG